MTALDIQGFASRKTVGNGAITIKLDGEFDFIGWSAADKALILIETKMLQPGTEPGFWKNQVDQFILGKNGKESFIEKLDRKANWLAKNSTKVAASLRAENILMDEEPAKVLACFITYAPIAAAYFVENFPCVSLSEFVTAYKRSTTWPFHTGVIDL